MLNKVVDICRAKGIDKLKDFVKESKKSKRSIQYWLQTEQISWENVRHSIAFQDLLEEGWWESSYPLHPEEPLVKYYGLYCSAWGVVLQKKAILRLGKRFYKYTEVGYYEEPYIRVAITSDKEKPRYEYLHNIVSKCFLGKRDTQVVRFKNGNTYDCHIWNLRLETKQGLEGESLPDERIDEVWGCNQCKEQTKTPIFRHDTTFCGVNCLDIYEEDLKFVQVSLDLLDEDWYNTPKD